MYRCVSACKKKYRSRTKKLSDCTKKCTVQRKKRKSYTKKHRSYKKSKTKGVPLEVRMKKEAAKYKPGTIHHRWALDPLSYGF